MKRPTEIFIIDCHSNGNSIAIAGKLDWPHCIDTLTF
jgi:hypothetical protein